MGKKFREFHVLEKIIHRKQNIYMVHTLLLTDLRNFNLTKYTIYTVYARVCSVCAAPKIVLVPLQSCTCINVNK